MLKRNHVIHAIPFFPVVVSSHVGLAGLNQTLQEMNAIRCSPSGGSPSAVKSEQTQGEGNVSLLVQNLKAKLCVSNISHYCFHFAGVNNKF